MDGLSDGLALIARARETLSAALVKTDNYYFERHDCPDAGQYVRVELSLKLKDEKTGDITLLGMCPHCGSAFYHNDVEK